MARPHLPLENLWAFHLVAEAGSLTRTAARLGVTQPAISRRIRDLEAQLGMPLVHRSANALTLTEAGKKLSGELRLGFGQLQRATEAFRSHHQPLRVRAYTTWAVRWLIPHLPKFEAQQLGIEVEVTTSTSAVDLARDGVDAAVRTAPLSHPPTPTARRLQPVRIAPFAAPSVAIHIQEGEAPEGRRLLGSKVRPDDWATWYRHSGQGAVPQPLLFESTIFAIQAAREGLGTVICSPAFVHEEVQLGRLVMLAEQSIEAGDCYWLVLPAVPLSDRLRTFADWLCTQAALEPAS